MQGDDSQNSTKPGTDPDPLFQRTRWSLVAVVRGKSGGEAGESLAQLCRSYCYPVYAYVRRCGHSPQLAYQVMQAFFAQLGQAMQRQDPAKYGRFRNFLLLKLAHFMAEDWRRDAAAAPQALPVEQSMAELEARHGRDPTGEGTPEAYFQRGFAMDVLTRGLHRLQLEAQQRGRLRMFELLEPYLHCDPEPGVYEHLAQQLGTRGVSVLMALKRLRQRFRELVDEELADTVTSEEALHAERAALLAILVAPS